MRAQSPTTRDGAPDGARGAAFEVRAAPVHRPSARRGAPIRWGSDRRLASRPDGSVRRRTLAAGRANWRATRQARWARHPGTSDRAHPTSAESAVATTGSFRSRLPSGSIGGGARRVGTTADKEGAMALGNHRRNLSPWTAISVALGVILILNSQGRSEGTAVIEGRSLVLRDANGQERIVLDAAHGETQDCALVELRRPDGSVAWKVYAEGAGAGFTMTDAAGKMRARLEEDAEGRVRLQLKDGRGE